MKKQKGLVGILIGLVLLLVIGNPYFVSAQYPGIGFGTLNEKFKDEKDQIKDLSKEEKKAAKQALKEKKTALKQKAKQEKEEIKAKEKEGWELTFLDNFNGEELDPTKWKHAPEWPRQGGAGQWSDDEAFLNGEGQLIIQVSEKDGKYYSGAVRTRDLFEQTYGYYEIKAKIPKTEGYWNAFWLMTDGVHTVGNDGRDGTEIDIFESPFAKDGDYIQHAMHWDGYEQYHRSAGQVAHVPGIYEGFHTFALEWNPDEYIFYIDGQETWRTNAGGVSQVPAYMKITAEVGGWAGNIKNATLPSQMEVEYVRAYKKKD
ncbi:family 16 glycosylhydrolase [Lederbergia wuyishanensis]|uniref:Beta-glucanase (GH16 family) n=1 Tax=Lederbergia wuyishanensis TaxID=1347903 RepID=A0ABU0D243_9BACI|nr:family 16 glycosylhydrolase [Lederbergia wuyishanensis]MCJ8007362.1 glycoside hydrolase family 16 protein [Lederbergia wuyishanensis]MDQ0342471.1 beta-glucanase (GH16 family) [Lederbergia wuyishanensis]